MRNTQESWIAGLRKDGVYVNGAHHSSQTLATEVARLAIGWIGGTQYHEAMNHIVLPRRNYTIREKEGTNWLMFRNSKWHEKHIQALWYQPSTENTLEREIVAIIKWQKDDIFPEHDAVKTLRDIIIRVAADPVMREKIQTLRSQIPAIEKSLVTVEEKSRARKFHELGTPWRQAAEERSKRFFWDFMEIAEWTQADLWAIHWLSWAWKLPANYGKTATYGVELGPDHECLLIDPDRANQVEMCRWILEDDIFIWLRELCT